MKKILAFLLALCMVLAACSAMAEVTYPIETSTTLTLWRVLDGSIVDGGYTTSMDTPGFKAWCEKTGIAVELKEFADGTSLVLALNGATTLPDMIMFNAGAYYNGGVAGLIADDVVQEIDPAMLEQYAPDYWTYINKPIYMTEIKQLDGKMYYMAGHIFEENSPYRYWRGLFYRGDLLEKVNKEVPKTADELYELLVALKGLDGVTTPMVFQGKDDLRESLRNGDLTSPFGLVCADDYQVDGKWHFGAYEPEYKEVLRFVKKLFDEGLISVDYLSMEGSVAQAAICNGEAGAFYGNNSRLNTFKNSLKDGEYFVPGAPLQTADGQRAMYSYADPMVAPGDAVYITPDCKNPELVLKLYNFLYTEKGRLIRDMGIEGESYTMVDGVPTYTDLVTHNPDGYSLDGVARSYALINWPGIHGDNQLRQRHPEQTQVDAYMLWGDTDHDKHVVSPEDVVLDEYTDEYASLWIDIELYINESRAKFINGELDIDKDWDNYISTLQTMGMDRVYEIKQQTLDAYATAFDG